MLLAGGTDTEMSHHKKLNLDKKIILRSCKDSNSRPFNHESTELAPSFATVWHLGTRHSLFGDSSALNNSNQPTKPCTGLSSKAVESFLGTNREKLNVYDKANQSFFYNVREAILSFNPTESKF